MIPTCPRHAGRCSLLPTTVYCSFKENFFKQTAKSSQSSFHSSLIPYYQLLLVWPWNTGSEVDQFCGNFNSASWSFWPENETPTCLNSSTLGSFSPPLRHRPPWEQCWSSSYQGFISSSPTLVSPSTHPNRPFSQQTVWHAGVRRAQVWMINWTMA